MEIVPLVKKRFWGYFSLIFRKSLKSKLRVTKQIQSLGKKNVWKIDENCVFGENRFLGIFSAITHHYFNAVTFSCGPCDSAYLTLYMHICSPWVLEMFI